MTSTVPGIISWPLIVLMAIILAARFRWCRANPYDTYLNSVLAWLLLTSLLRERDVEEFLSRAALLTASSSRQLSAPALTIAGTEMVGFVLLWRRLSTDEVRRQHSYYRLAAVIAGAGFLAAATPARVANSTLEATGGWAEVWAFAFHLGVFFLLFTLTTWMFASELKRATNNRERWLGVAGIVISVWVGVSILEAPILAATDQLGWTHTVDLRLRYHSVVIFWMTVSLYILGAVRLAVRLHSYLGRDRISRTWTGLQTLRLSMTTVVPESRFDLDHDDRRYQKTTLQLHQTVIEIRDAILQLRPYVGEIAPSERTRFLEANSVPASEHDAATHAFELARAIRAKGAGAPRQESSDMALFVRSRSTSLDEEAATLLVLGKWWTPATFHAA